MQRSLFASNLIPNIKAKEENILSTAYAINYNTFNHTEEPSQNSGRVAIPDFSVKKNPIKYSIPKKEDMMQ